MIEGGILTDKVVEFLSVKQNGFYIDATAGSGWLASAILDRLSGSGRLLLLDIDRDAVESLEKESKFPSQM